MKDNVIEERRRMTQSKGYAGQILWVNLTEKKIVQESPDENIYRSYLGGYGLGVYYIYSRISPRCDPLGPENIIGFCPGLLTGTAAPFTGRFMVCGKSPRTGRGITTEGWKSNGGWGDSNCGGFFGAALKRAGYDAVFVTGQSKTPMYLLITKENAELVDASHLWGKDTYETEDLLKEKHGTRMEVASIGLAGENKALIAGIVTDHGRIAARSGLGAVMGSKHLKALCVGGTQKPILDNKEEFMKFTKNYTEKLQKLLKKDLLGKSLKIAPKMGNAFRIFGITFGDSVQTLVKLPGMTAEATNANSLHRYGSGFALTTSIAVGDASTKNFGGIGYMEYPQKIGYNKLVKVLADIETKPYGCFGCPLRCGATMSVPELSIKKTHRPEYETLASFSSNILMTNPMLMIRINDRLNRQGMDTISAGLTVSFILECVQHGLLTKEDFKCTQYPQGFLPQWNESEYLMPLIEMMINREGIGDLLADGTQKASSQIRNSESFAMHANGEEFPMHDPRMIPGLMTTYIADPTPGRHTAANIDYIHIYAIKHFSKEYKFTRSKDREKNGWHQARFVKFYQGFNALGLCMYSLGVGPYPLFNLLNNATGWKMTPEEFLESGWRIQTLRQMFNAREGAIHHNAPERLLGDPPMSKGPLKNVSIAAEKDIQAYYKHIGFEENGIPCWETLKQLNLDFCISDLERSCGRPEAIRNRYLETKTGK